MSAEVIVSRTLTKPGRAVAGLIIPLVTATVLGQLPSRPARAETALTSATDVSGIKVQPAEWTPRSEYTATARELTEADLPPDTVTPSGVQTVQLAAATAKSALAAPSRRVQAGSLPVYLAAPPAPAPSAAARAATAPVSRVRVELADTATARSAGVKGMLLRLSRADGAQQAGQTTVTLDYRSAAGSFGSDALTRLHLISLSNHQQVPAVNDTKAGTLTATVPLAAAGRVTSFALAAAAGGENGDFKATTLTAASTWQVTQQTGAFTWSYPVKVPSPPGGVAPDLKLSYSSASIDGRTSGNNTQGSWIGDGWSLEPGYIERSFRSCPDDRDEKETPDPNNTDIGGDDLCWFNDNATMSFNGGSTELVKVAGNDDKKVLYRGVTDDGSRIEQIKDTTANGDVDGTHWRVTTLNGTQYYFGQASAGDGSSAGTATNSTWTAPVYSNNPGEPGYDKDFSKSRNTRAWRWNLDYAVDSNGNTITYVYNKETGAYGTQGDKDKRVTYDRGGSLARIEYGVRTDSAATTRPADRVVFDTVDRCLGTCIDANGKPIAKRFPDTPWDQYCDKAPCTTQFSPTFWTQKRLNKITTQVYAGSGDTYTDVDTWSLAQAYLQAGGNESTPMWLKSITHTGNVTTAGGPAVTYPAVVFDPNADVMPNRVDTPTGHTSLFRNRIQAITTESGAQYGITYSEPECDGITLPKPWANTKRCYPQYYAAEGEDSKIDWFNKYVVTRVDVYDNTGGFEHEQTNYDYLDSPAWAYDDSELVKPKQRTWGQFRGYGHVQVRNGVESGVQSKVDYLYFRGLDGDKQPKTDELPPTGAPRSVQVKDSQGGLITDHPAYAGMMREQTTYNGSDWISGTIATPVQTGPTATAGALKAWKVHTETVRTRTRLSTGATRWTQTITKVNADNLTTQVSDLGDEADPNDDRCSRTTYARNESAWMLDRVSETEIVGVKCDATAQRPADVLSDVRTYYDRPDPFGATPGRGLPVRTETLDHWDGSTPVYTLVNTTGYDDLGRATSQTDALGHTTATEFTPALTGPVTGIKTINPKKQSSTVTLNPAIGQQVKTVGTNGETTQATYDGAGRLLQVWIPGRDKATYPADPSFSYTYQLRNDAPSTVTTKKLMPSGSKTYRTSVALYDGLLRERQTQTQSIAGGRAITDTVYDSRGLLAWTSSPYYDTDNTAPNTTLVTPVKRPEIPALTQNLYDGAGRQTDAITVIRGDEQWRTHTTNSGERVSVTPPTGGIATTAITDARGHQTEVREYKDPAKVGSDDSATFDRFTYGYNGRDELQKVAGLAGNTWTYQYDLRGHKIATSDPDTGNTTSGYDAIGQLRWTKSATGKTLYYDYDELGRKRTEREDSATGRELAEWEYDTLALGAGKASKSTRYEYDAAGNASAYINAVTGYDKYGRATGSSVTIPAADGGLCMTGTTAPCTYKQSNTYRPNGEPDQVTLPAVPGLAAETLTSLYNTIGLANGLIGKQIYAQEVVYNQLGQMIGQNLGEHGSRVGLSYGYDETTGRQTSYNAVPELKTDIYNLSYTYNNAGTITSITDTPDAGQAGEVQCFGYDYLQRLTDAWTQTTASCPVTPSGAATGPAPYWRSYAYDQAGNRQTELDHSVTTTTRTYSYPASGGAAGTKPHAAAQVTSTGGTPKTLQYAYNADGNTTCRPAATTQNSCAADGSAGAESQALSWNAEGKLAKSTDKTGTTSYIYDADGNRLIRRDPTGSTLYLPGGTEVRKPTSSTATSTRYYSHAGNVIAVRTATALTWMINDHQGSATATVNATTLAATRRRALPFGDDRGTKPATWAGDKGFVGGTRDNTGLTHLDAREYDPTLGRFISVDPMMDLADPQQWNAYNYADDSPINRSDPTGLLADCGAYTFMSCGGSPTSGGGNNGNGGDTGSGGGDNGGGDNGSGGNSQNGTGGNQNGNSGGNTTTASVTVAEKSKCGKFDWLCDGWQRTMENVHENRHALADIAIDLAQIEGGLLLMQAGPLVAAGGLVITIGSGGTAVVVGTPAIAVGGVMVVGGTTMAGYGAWNLGKDVQNLHWNNEATGGGSSTGSAGHTLGDTSTVQGWIPDKIPAASERVISDIQERGVTLHGPEGNLEGPSIPEMFENSGRRNGYRLRDTDSTGEPVKYREWGTVQSPQNPRPGGERIVTGSDGSVYYTPTHYQTWIVAVAGK